MTSIDQHDNPQPYAVPVLGGQSPAVKRMRLQLARIAPYFRVTLLVGEAGTGKQTVARELHRLSPIAERPFRTWHPAECAMPKGPGGTIYLRGLETIPVADQSRLLRSFKAMDRDKRLIIATQLDPKGLLATGRLRHDLHVAIANLEIRVPPLRERLEDLEQAMRALAHTATDTQALSLLRRHAWPGNFEELHRLCQSFEHSRKPITAADLPSLTRTQPSLSPRLDDVMHRHVREVLEGCAGNKLRAAELLGISRSTLYRMLGVAAG
jgi:two-component system response regulator HydG